jgi:hypothetical protein
MLDEPVPAASAWESRSVRRAGSEPDLKKESFGLRKGRRPVARLPGADCRKEGAGPQE